MIFLLFLSRQYHIDIVFDFTSPKEKGMMANGKASQLSVSQPYAHSTRPWCCEGSDAMPSFCKPRQ